VVQAIAPEADRNGNAVREIEQDRASIAIRTTLALVKT
jgi:hypothetical protein